MLTKRVELVSTFFSKTTSIDFWLQNCVIITNDIQNKQKVGDARVLVLMLIVSPLKKLEQIDEIRNEETF